MTKDITIRTLIQSDIDVLVKEFAKAKITISFCGL